ncbi:hypothetical protein RUE5091_04351 [Ruegeria denitrificans]|uniref:Uncharacterized protein n=1 Tax=Ruegeria denitrificans TaxID=1715692 RepID=A0A0P1IK83_9RHOB|nr:hypothetical protein RUE5091_04351 [Ruegeria denitrificans]
MPLMVISAANAAKARLVASCTTAVETLANVSYGPFLVWAEWLSLAGCCVASNGYSEPKAEVHSPKAKRVVLDDFALAWSQVAKTNIQTPIP